VNRENSQGHGAAAQQVRAVIESLIREASTPTDAGDWRSRFRTVSITAGEGDALRKWVINENAAHL
jgi:hypothetical protein